MSATWLLRLATAAGALALVGWAVQRGTAQGVWRHHELVEYLLWGHLYLVGVSGGAAVAVGIAAGIALSRRALRRVAEPAMQILNLGNTIPTLAILALAMSVIGIGASAAIFGLFVHSLLPIARNTFVGLTGLSPFMIEAATGMGMTPTQTLWRVEVPNALPVIMAGIRTALVINVGTAPLAFLIGGGGLGELIFAGIDLFDPGMMLAGAIPVSLLAIAVNVGFDRLTAILVPRGVALAR